jgi:hypothetical protein
MYNISPYAYAIAKKMNLLLKPSTVKDKKIDVYKNDEKIASIGALGMNDYQMYIKSHGKAYANERRRLYYIRHPNNNTLNERLSKKLLWGF